MDRAVRFFLHLLQLRPRYFASLIRRAWRSFPCTKLNLLVAPDLPVLAYFAARHCRKATFHAQ
jgi:hypothetical protein